MHRWLTKITLFGGGEEQISTVTRPHVGTHGSGDTLMLRIADPAGEYWFPFPVQSVEIEEVAQVGLLETLHEKDLDLISKQAFDLKRSDDVDEHVLGDIILEVLRHYKTILEVIEHDMEVANASSESS
jgi:hypothetical protein